MSVQHKSQRVAVFIDVQNMYYSARNLYSKKVNFAKILDIAIASRSLVRAFAYVIKADVKEEEGFFEALEKIGFEVKAKELQVFFGGAKKGDWDVGIAMDVVRMAPKVDTCVLVSGDGDFKELLQYVKAQGCRAEVIAFGKSASSKIKQESDSFYDLDKHKKSILRAIKKPSGGKRRSSRASSSSKNSKSNSSSNSSGSSSNSSSSTSPHQPPPQIKSKGKEVYKQ